MAPTDPPAPSGPEPGAPASEASDAGAAPDADAFIARWRESGGHERANYQLFLAELCDLLGAPRPDPARPENAENAYVFERSVTRTRPDGATSTVFLDLYRAGCFVLETKQGAAADPTGSGAGETLLPPASHPVVSTGHGRRGTAGYDKAMEKAYNQASGYIRDLPASEGRPPFLVVCDVGHVFELYAEFTRSGGRYQRFPDPRNHRIHLEDLRDPEKRELLRTIWTDPMSLDPSRRVARVTRDIAGRLAALARSLEAAGHDPESVALFLQRCLFTMFAEDIGLLPEHGFLELLRKIGDAPQGFPVMIEGLWNDMARGAEFSAVLLQKVAHFNGGLFENPTALPLSGEQIALLVHAAESDWTEVDPAIFGTLLERALDPRERHKLGAHYTPRSYVERLIEPTVMEPLREEWQAVKAAAVQLLDQGQEKKARAEVEAWHHRLCRVRVLDPACGSGNFLYVTLEHLKRLEAEVLDFLESIGGDRTLEMDSFKVRPSQFLGLEISPSAARIAQLVLWIGYFQWHYRATGAADTNDRPLLQDEETIENRDAVLAYDEKIPRRDEDGNVITIWDGQTTRPHPVTGNEVPDESARKVVYDYVNPRRPEWPEADFVVGNPPFIGNKRMRFSLGDGYVEALRQAFKKQKPNGWDFVMFWWQTCADLLQNGEIRRFGLITTNSIHQSFNRRVLEHYLNSTKNAVHISFAIPDHPWVDSTDGAAVRIAMTVAASGRKTGTLARVTLETEIDDGEHDVEFTKKPAEILPSLSEGARLSDLEPLDSNSLLSGQGVIVLGEGFLLTRDEKERLLRDEPDAKKFVRPYMNGSDLVRTSRKLEIIDLNGMTEDELKDFPATYQRIFTLVRPNRLQMKDKQRRTKWWLFGRTNQILRNCLEKLPRYIATCRTAKHRIFSFIDGNILPDAKIVAIGLSDSFHLGTLSSLIHELWSERVGVRMGVGNDLNYNHSDCFGKFPFPDPDEETKQRIRDLGEKLDAHRKRQQELHPGLTLTGIYNVLEKLRAAEGRDGRPGRPPNGPPGSATAETAPGADPGPCAGAPPATRPAGTSGPTESGVLTEKERRIHDDGLVSVLRQIHDELDAAVFHAYGWDDLGERFASSAPGSPAREEAEAELLERLVALNHERAEEEKRGLVRWLRPDFQAPGETGVPAARQTEIELEAEKAAARPAAQVEKLAWPDSLPEQVAAVQKLLPALGPDPGALSAAFGRRSSRRATQIAGILTTLDALGQL